MAVFMRGSTRGVGGSWMTSAKDAVQAAEGRAAVLPGTDERFSGWGVMGLPFSSGDVFATRRFSASSVGPGYSSVWHRDAAGIWTFYTDVSPEMACPRYFGAAIGKAISCPITFSWTGPKSLHVDVADAGLSCDLAVTSTVASRMMNAMASVMPELAWRSPRVLRAISAMAGPMLGAGKLAMFGRAPNGQQYFANPRKMWVVAEATLHAGDRVANHPGPLSPQAQLGDFYIPQRGILAIGNAAFDPLDPQLHSVAVSMES